jgi:LmbE family N-acetylglucosaminyl deacetylase
MVLSGSGERVVFVHELPGDESLVTGGTVARLRSAGVRVVVLFGAGAPDGAQARAALAELGVSEWRMLPAASVEDPEADRSALAEALRQILGEVRPTAVMIGTDDERLRLAATRAAHAAGLPAYLSRRVAGGAGQRLTAIDVSDHVEQKLRALASYPGRWTVAGRAVRLADGSLLAVTGTETYLRLDPPPGPPVGMPVGMPQTLAGRLLVSAAALVVGVVFGLLGTIAHQATIPIGPVTLPAGLILALAAVAALLAGLRLVLGDRLPVFACALGMLGTIFLLSLRSAGGSVLVPAGLAGTLWTVAPTLIATLVLAWPKLPAKR